MKIRCWSRTGGRRSSHYYRRKRESHCDYLSGFRVADLGVEVSMTGLLATSKAGHDKDSVYVIIREEGEYVYIADGEGRTVEKPKRKNKKHIQLIKKKKLSQTAGGFNDIDIKRIIKVYQKERKEREERNVKG